MSFINAIAEVCEAAGADVKTIAAAMGHDYRIGKHYLRSGLGFAAAACPRTSGPSWPGPTSSVSATPSVFSRRSTASTCRRRQRTVDWARELVGGDFTDRNVGVLGASFKPDSDDFRDSPALAVAVAMQRAGARVRVHDPEAGANVRAAHPELDVVEDVSKACEGADVVLHLTEWSEYQVLDLAELAELTRTPRVLDARSALDLDAWRAAGWTANALGRPNA